MNRFFDNFVMPAVTGVPKPREEILGALHSSTELLAEKQGADEIIEGRNVFHFGQVLPIEDVEEVIDMVD